MTTSSDDGKNALSSRSSITIGTSSSPGGASHNSVPWSALMVLVIGGFMAILDGSIVNVALPKLMAVFGVSADSIQWVMTAYLLTSGVVVPITGYLSDRFGSKNLYIFSLSVFTIGSGLCALAWSNNSLVVARVLQALGGGMMLPVSMAIVYRIVPRNKIGLAMGVWGISAMAAPTIGPTLGGYLVDNLGWKWIFTVNIPVGVTAVFLSLIVLEEMPKRGNLKLDFLGALTSGAGCFALLLALSQGQDKGWTSLYIVNLFIFAAFCFLFFIAWELTVPQPLIDLRLLKNRTFSISLVATAFATVGLYAGIFLIPLYTQTVLGYTPMQTGLLLMPMAMTSGLMMPISGRLFDRFGAAPLSLIGMMITAITTYKLHTISYEMSYHSLQLLLVERAFGMGMAMMPMSTAGMNTIPHLLVPRATALNNLIRQISASFGIAYLTYEMLSRQDYHAARMVESVSYSSPVAATTLSKIQALLLQEGLDPQSAALGAPGVISLIIHREAFIAGIADAFIIATLFIILIIPLTLFLNKKAVENETKKQSHRFAHLSPPNMGGSLGIKKSYFENESS